MITVYTSRKIDSCQVISEKRRNKKTHASFSKKLKQNLDK